MHTHTYTHPLRQASPSPQGASSREQQRWRPWEEAVVAAGPTRTRPAASWAVSQLMRAMNERSIGWMEAWDGHGAAGVWKQTSQHADAARDDDPSTLPLPPNVNQNNRRRPRRRGPGRGPVGDAAAGGGAQVRGRGGALQAVLAGGKGLGDGVLGVWLDEVWGARRRHVHR